MKTDPKSIISTLSSDAFREGLADGFLAPLSVVGALGMAVKTELVKVAPAKLTYSVRRVGSALTIKMVQEEQESLGRRTETPKGGRALSTEQKVKQIKHNVELLKKLGGYRGLKARKIVRGADGKIIFHPDNKPAAKPSRRQR